MNTVKEKPITKREARRMKTISTFQVLLEVDTLMRKKKGWEEFDKRSFKSVAHIFRRHRCTRKFTG